MKTEILTLLRQGEEYVSGQQICDRLGVSRTAIWKAVNGLKEEGYVIEAVQNKGYRLISAPDVLTEGEIRSRRLTEWAGCIVEAHERIGYSTNLRAKQLADQGAVHGTLVTADVQEGGKGRRGRPWAAAAPGENIAMSIILRPELAPVQASMLTLITALAVRDEIRALTGICPKIKWPNDVVVNGRKICGILTEMALEAEYIQYLVVGIGINVNNEGFAPELAEKATSLTAETGRRFSRAELICHVLKHFEQYYEVFMRTGDLSALRENYNGSLAGRNQAVRVLAPGQEWEGISRGINETGALLVEHPDGQLEEISAGEVSVRGIYGYI